VELEKGVNCYRGVTGGGDVADEFIDRRRERKLTEWRGS